MYEYTIRNQPPPAYSNLPQSIAAQLETATKALAHGNHKMQGEETDERPSPIKLQCNKDDDDRPLYYNKDTSTNTYIQDPASSNHISNDNDDQIQEGDDDTSLQKTKQYSCKRRKNKILPVSNVGSNKKDVKAIKTVAKKDVSCNNKQKAGGEKTSLYSDEVHTMAKNVEIKPPGRNTNRKGLETDVDIQDQHIVQDDITIKSSNGMQLKRKPLEGM